MLINDQSKYRLTDCTAQAILENSGGHADVAAEHRMDVYLNDRLAMRVVCTPEHLDELAVGRLLTEGLIRQPGDIRTVFLCEWGTRAKIMLSETAGAQLMDAETAAVSTCCTDNRTLLSSERPLKPVRPAAWDPQWLLGIAERMREEEPLYGKTHAVHACYLAEEDRILCVREDIGRHNALDKVIGWACIHEIDLGRCLLFTTGRMPADMVSKAIQCGVPVMASKTYPTDQGIGLARQANLTLVTVRPGGRIYVWNDGMKTAAEETT